jgi:radical SAM protein with 4Fe4S-binding SPASM domain
MWETSSGVTNLAISFTNRCNLHCSYCYFYSKQEVEQNELSLSDLIEVVDKALGYFCGVHTVELWGGEPMIDPERLNGFASAMKQRGIQVVVPSINGTLLGSKEHYEAWKPISLARGSQISFDGNKKFHDKHRCGTYDTVVENLRLSILRQDNLSIRTTYSFDDFFDSVKENLEAYPTLYKKFLAEGLSPKEVNRVFSMFEYGGKKFLAVFQEIDSIFSETDLLEKAAKYRESYVAFSQLLPNLLENDVLFLPPYVTDMVGSMIQKNPYFGTKHCGSFFTQLFLHTASGGIYSCLSQDAKDYEQIACLANVNTGKVNWPTLNAVRSFTYRRNRECYQCLFQDACFGGCYHMIPSGGSNKFNSYWNTARISKCVLAHSIFDVVVDMATKILDRLGESPDATYNSCVTCSSSCKC